MENKIYIIEVIPFASLPPQIPQLLSYFSSQQLVKGALVEIAIGNRKVPGVVISSSDLDSRKAMLKKSAFQIKKINKVISEEPMVSEETLKLALWLSKKYFAPLGSCLRTVLPNFFTTKKYIPSPAKISKDKKELKPVLLLSSARDFLKNVGPNIKKITGQKLQVLLVFPEISIAEHYAEILSKDYKTALIHGKISPKKFYSEWNRILAGEVEVIVGTRQSLFLQFKDLGLIVIEDPSNEAYKSDMTPKYVTSDVAIKISEMYQCPLVMVTRIPDVNGYMLAKQKQYQLIDKLSENKTDITLIDMVDELSGGNFTMLGKRVKEKIKSELEAKGRVLIFSSRRGYAGAFMCIDCRKSFKCPNCSIPLRYNKIPAPILVCNRCSSVHKVPEVCPKCHNYNLKAVSFPGSQKLEEEIQNFIKINELKTEIIVLDSTTAKTPKSEKALLKKISDSNSYICIATQMIFSHRFQKMFNLVVMPNVDSLTSIPDFRSEEGLFYQFNKLLDFEPDEIFMQTYHADNPLLELVLKNDYKAFYENELPMRKLFSYPPFAGLIKLSFKSMDQRKASQEAGLVVEKMKIGLARSNSKEFIKILGPSPAFVEKEKNYYIYNIILKVLPGGRPEEVLRLVPSHWIVDVDPKSIL